MVSYICIYDIINRKTYLKTLYLIPNTFKEWAENFKSLPQYCPVMGSIGTFFTIIAHLPWDHVGHFNFLQTSYLCFAKVDLMSVTNLSLGKTFGRFRQYFNFLFLPVWNINLLNMQLLFIFVACDFASCKKIFDW